MFQENCHDGKVNREVDFCLQKLKAYEAPEQSSILRHRHKGAFRQPAVRSPRLAAALQNLTPAIDANLRVFSNGHHYRLCDALRAWGLVSWQCGGTLRRTFGDRRRHPRYDIHGDLLATFDSSQTLRIADIGFDGALVCTSAPLPVQSVHTARLIIGSDESDVRFRVSHVSPVDGSGRAYVLGVEFLELSRVAVTAIQLMMARVADAEVKES
ncbi:MAG: PilZ domain-containing protein [Vicinamibacterales bacterium]